MPLPIAHDTALRWTRYAWVGLIAAAVIAIGAPLLPTPTVQAPDLTPPELPPPGGAGAPDESAEVADVVWIDLEAVLRTIHAVERPGDQSGAGETPDDAATSEAAAAGAESIENLGLPGWKYVGDVTLGGRVVAVISVAGAQRFLSEGDEAQGFTIDSIAPDHVMAQGRDGRFRIAREQAPAPALRSAPMRSAPVRPSADDAARLRDERLRPPGEQR